jgi:hypothetical protein
MKRVVNPDRVYRSGREILAEQGLILEIAIIPKVLLNPEIGAILIRED